MAKPGAERRDWKQSIRPALIISLAMGVVAGVVATVASSGGTKNGLNVQFGGIAFLIAFVVGLLVISLLMMVAKENSGDMGRGSGVNRSSELSDDELRALEAKEAGRTVAERPDAAPRAERPDAEAPGAERPGTEAPGAEAPGAAPRA